MHSRKKPLELYIKTLKETRNSLKKCPLNLWWALNKSIMEVGNITNTATFKRFLHLSYKNTQLFLLWQCFFNIFHKANINQWFLGVTQKYELRVSFNSSLHDLLAKGGSFKTDFHNFQIIHSTENEVFH